ncbi:hypothetical protein P7C70_g9439, partial [Phenoliferia sp. Uapishka_3]
KGYFVPRIEVVVPKDFSDLCFPWVEKALADVAASAEAGREDTRLQLNLLVRLRPFIIIQLAALYEICPESKLFSHCHIFKMPDPATKNEERVVDRRTVKARLFAWFKGDYLRQVESITSKHKARLRSTSGIQDVQLKSCVNALQTDTEAIRSEATELMLKVDAIYAAIKSPSRARDVTEALKREGFVDPRRSSSFSPPPPAALPRFIPRKSVDPSPLPPSPPRSTSPAATSDITTSSEPDVADDVPNTPPSQTQTPPLHPIPSSSPTFLYPPLPAYFSSDRLVHQITRTEPRHWPDVLNGIKRPGLLWAAYGPKPNSHFANVREMYDAWVLDRIEVSKDGTTRRLPPFSLLESDFSGSANGSIPGWRSAENTVSHFARL